MITKKIERKKITLTQCVHKHTMQIQVYNDWFQFTQRNIMCVNVGLGRQHTINIYTLNTTCCHLHVKVLLTKTPIRQLPVAFMRYQEQHTHTHTHTILPIIYMWTNVTTCEDVQNTTTHSEKNTIGKQGTLLGEKQNNASVIKILVYLQIFSISRS